MLEPLRAFRGRLSATKALRQSALESTSGRDVAKPKPAPQTSTTLRVWPSLLVEGISPEVLLFVSWAQLLARHLEDHELDRLSLRWCSDQLAQHGVLASTGRPLGRNVIGRWLRTAQSEGLMAGWKVKLGPPFVQLPLWIAQLSIPAGAKLLAAYLPSNGAPGTWAPSQASLAASLGQSERTIRWWLAQLRAAGAVRRGREKSRRPYRVVPRPDRPDGRPRSLVNPGDVPMPAPASDPAIQAALRPRPDREQLVAAALQRLRRECEDNNVREDRTREAYDLGIDLETHLRELAEEHTE